MIIPKDKAKGKHPQGSKEKHRAKDNITPFHSRSSIEKERLRLISYEVNSIEDIVDLLNDRVASQHSFERSAYILLREKTNRILRIAGSVKREAYRAP